MLLPKAISAGDAFKKSAQTSRAYSMRGVRLGAGWIGPVSVRVVVIEVVAHPFDDMPRHLRTARSIKVRYRITVVNALERREVTSDFRD